CSSDLATPLLGVDPELAAKLGASERAELASATSHGRRAMLIDFFPSRDRAAQGINITVVRERIAKVAEIVRVVPRVVAESDLAPGGMAFEIFVTTEATDDVLREAAWASAEHLHVLSTDDTTTIPPINKPK